MLVADVGSVPRDRRSRLRRPRRRRRAGRLRLRRRRAFRSVGGSDLRARESSKVEVAVAGEIDPATGYVLDLKRLSDVICRLIIQDVDHRNLNTDVAWLEGLIPTAENLAMAFWERVRPELPEGLLRSVRLWETDKN